MRICVRLVPPPKHAYIPASTQWGWTVCDAVKLYRPCAHPVFLGSWNRKGRTVMPSAGEAQLCLARNYVGRYERGGFA